MTTIAVTGATGQLGRIAIEKLKALAPQAKIIGLVRDLSKGAELGVEVRSADYNQPASLEQALQGVDKLLLISGNEVGKRAPQHKNVIEAAKKAGVKHIVYTSLLRADSSPLNLAQEHVETEQMLQQSGLIYSILRNGWYHENYTDSAPIAVANGAFYGSAQEGKISSASRADLAEAAAVVLTSTGHENKIYELAGDQAYSLAELATEISRQTGKDIPYVNLSVQDYTSALVQAGLPADFAAMIAGWDQDAAAGALFSADKTLSQLLGRPTTPVAISLELALKA